MPEIPTNAEIRDSVRRRPVMYFGSTGARGVEQFAYELVSNVLDLYLLGRATRVDVNLDGSTISVADDGSGLPFDEPSDLEGISRATKFLTHPHQQPSWDNHAPHVHLTTCGVGLAIVNMGSALMKVQSWRSGSLWQQTFEQGIASGPAIVVEQGSGRGTRIDLTLDSDIFGDSQPRHDVIRKKLFEAAHLFSGLRIQWNEEVFLSHGGLRSLGLFTCDSLSSNFFALHSPLFHLKQTVRQAVIEVALCGEQQHPSGSIHSWVNGARIYEGGSHVDGLKQVLQLVGWEPELSLMHIIMLEPEFAGPTKTKLVAPHIRELIHDVLLEPIQVYKSQFDASSWY